MMKRSHVMLYGAASLLDGLIMLLLFGGRISSLRGSASLWIARRRIATKDDFAEGKKL